ncbi:hypothetical protein [Thermus sp.]|uniref:hypothetical protein n=1 Tax=Thermus sp. TaxID=275 RepID=UPI003D0C28C5
MTATYVPAPGTLKLTAVLATPLGNDPNPDVQAKGERGEASHRTWGSSTYQVPSGMYTVTAKPISKQFTSQGLSYQADYTASVSAESVRVLPGGNAEATATYTVVNGTLCTYGGCESVKPGVYTLRKESYGEEGTSEDTYERDEDIITTTTESIWATFIKYDPSEYAVSSDQTVQASYSSFRGLTHLRYTQELKYKDTGETKTIIDVEYNFHYDITPSCRGWTLVYSEWIDHLTGQQSSSYPNTCL